MTKDEIISHIKNRMAGYRESSKAWANGEYYDNALKDKVKLDELKNLLAWIE